MRPNKLEDFSLETLSSQVLEFEGKARANPIGLHHLLDGVTNSEYKLLCFIQLTNFFVKR